MLGVKNSIDKYKLLVKQYWRYEKDKMAEDRVQAIFDTAWSLTEWVGKEFKGVSSKKDLREFRETLYSIYPPFKIIADIVDHSKHFKLSGPKSNLVDAGKREGPFASSFTESFQKERLLIELNDGSYYNVEQMIDETISFWTVYFQDHLKIDSRKLAVRLEDSIKF